MDHQECQNNNFEPAAHIEADILIDESSCVHYIAWDKNHKETTGDLIVYFKPTTNATISKYRYFNVPIQIVSELIQSNSYGKYIHKNIINKYRYVQIGETPEG